LVREEKKLVRGGEKFVMVERESGKKMRKKTL
jgi:hypothetical protein